MMAPPSKRAEKAWAKWAESRPPVVRDIARLIFPWQLYRLKTTGQRVTLYSINENGTVTVDITGEFNLIDFDRQVFGINPDDLEPCDLPGPDELLGTLMSPQDVEDNIDAMRVEVRPDLWVMGPDGKAVRKS